MNSFGGSFTQSLRQIRSRIWLNTPLFSKRLSLFQVNAKFVQLSIAVTKAAESDTAGGSGGDKVTVVAAGNVPSSLASPSPGARCLPSPLSPRPRNRPPSSKEPLYIQKYRTYSSRLIIALLIIF